MPKVPGASTKIRYRCRKCMRTVPLTADGSFEIHGDKGKPPCEGVYTPWQKIPKAHKNAVARKVPGLARREARTGKLIVEILSKKKDPAAIRAQANRKRYLDSAAYKSRQTAAKDSWRAINKVNAERFEINRQRRIDNHEEPFVPPKPTDLKKPVRPVIFNGGSPGLGKRR